MNSNDFIIENLNEISRSIKGIHIRYGFDSISNFHIIEIAPESIRRGSLEYVELEGKLWNDFYHNFPNEDILICEMSESVIANELIFEKISFTETMSEPTYNISFSMKEGKAVEKLCYATCFSSENNYEIAA